MGIALFLILIVLLSGIYKEEMKELFLKARSAINR